MIQYRHDHSLFLMTVDTADPVTVFHHIKWYRRSFLLNALNLYYRLTAYQPLLKVLFYAGPQQLSIDEKIKFFLFIAIICKTIVKYGNGKDGNGKSDTELVSIYDVT